MNDDGGAGDPGPADSSGSGGPTGAAGPGGDARQAGPRKRRSFWKELPILIAAALVLALLVNGGHARYR
jgi:signal peptidase I